MRDHVGPSAIATYYAPPARATQDSIEADRLTFERETLLTEAMAAFPDVFLILNEQRQIVFANRRVLELLGFTDLGTVLGMRPGEVLLCQHAKEMAAGCGTSEFCRECGAVRAIVGCLNGQENTQECRILREDGEALDLRVRARPFVSGSRTYVLFAITDIGHEKRRRALEKIFFHDILNTAGGMVGIGEILQEGSAEDISEFKDSVLALAQNLIDEIKAQQVLAAAESGELVARPSTFNSRDLVQSVGNTFRTNPVCEGRQLEIAATAESATMVSDPTLLRRVLGNMVKNALEATAQGGVVTLDCRAVDDGEAIEFAVHNPGVMARSVQLQVFNRSFSTKSSDRGLGTYSMKLLSERYLQGRIAFTSTPERGTIFVARYPRLPVSRAAE